MPTPRYTLLEKIGEGAYGKVYKAKKESEVYAIKIPRIIASGSYHKADFIVMPLLRISLMQLLQLIPSYYTRQSVAMIGQSLLDILMYIHKCGFVYRDFKPENIMFGFDNKVHLIDYGVCSRYVDNEGRHVREEMSKNFVGTARYASIWTHQGLIQSRRDDLESLGYVLLFLLNGRLPWAQVPGAYNSMSEKQIGESKKKMTLRELCGECEERDLWIAYFRHIRSLKFSDQPNYSFLKSVLRKIGGRKGNKLNSCVRKGIQFCC